MVAMHWVDGYPVFEMMLLHRGRSHSDNHPILNETSGGTDPIKPADG